MNDLSSLTEKQQEIYQFIKDYIQDKGYPPAIRDIGKHFKIVSPNGVMCHLKALQKKGFIQRDVKDADKGQGGKARSITIPGEVRGGFSLPLLGMVAAGKTLETTQENDRLELKDLFGGEELYALKVRGTSMIESQIADGDYVVIKKQEQADNGQKVVAMVDKAMTLKKFYKKKDQITLQPCNNTMDPIQVDPSKHNVQILGLLVGVIRRC
jgi:repressor LexA